MPESSSIKSKLPYVILYSVIILIAVGGSLFFIKSYKKYQAEKEAKEKALQEEAKRKAEEEKAKLVALKLEREQAAEKKKKEAYDKAIEFAKKNKDNPKLAINYLQKMKKFLAGSEYEVMLGAEIKKFQKIKPKKEDKNKISAAAMRVMESLKYQAKSFVDGKQFMKAAEIYRDYNGQNKDETSKARQKFVEKYFKMARDYGNQAVEADKLFDKVMLSIGEDILRGKYDLAVKKLKGALKKPELEMRKYDLESAVSTIEKLKRMKDALKESFMSDKGKTVKIPLRRGYIKGKILDVKGSSIIILAEAKKGALKKTISMNSISSKERLKRISSFCGTETLAVYKALTYFRRRKPDKAKEYLNNAGIFKKPMIQAIGDWEVRKMKRDLGD